MDMNMDRVSNYRAAEKANLNLGLAGRFQECVVETYKYSNGNRKHASSHCGGIALRWTSSIRYSSAYQRFHAEFRFTCTSANDVEMEWNKEQLLELKAAVDKAIELIGDLEAKQHGNAE